MQTKKNQFKRQIQHLSRNSNLKKKKTFSNKLYMIFGVFEENRTIFESKVLFKYCLQNKKN